MLTSLKKESLRKTFHLTAEISYILVYSFLRYFWNEQAAFLGLTFILLILLEIEYARLEVKLQMPKFFFLFIRRKEYNNVASSLFIATATIIAFASFNYAIAMLALLFAVFGDITSAIVGIKFGKHKIFRSKTLEGFLAGFAINLLVGFLILPAYPIVFISMATVASVVELLTNKLDDNLTVPIFSGFTGQMLIYILGIQILEFPYPFEWLFNFF
jgi:phytol kinase